MSTSSRPSSRTVSGAPTISAPRSTFRRAPRRGSRRGDLAGVYTDRRTVQSLDIPSGPFGATSPASGEDNRSAFADLPPDCASLDTPSGPSGHLPGKRGGQPVGFRRPTLRPLRGHLAGKRGGQLT